MLPFFSICAVYFKENFRNPSDLVNFQAKREGKTSCSVEIEFEDNGDEFYTAILVDNGKLFDPTYEVLLRSEKKLKKPLNIEYIKYGGRQNNVKGNASISYEISNGKHLALVNGAYSFLSYVKIKNRNVWVLNVPEIKDRIMDEISGVEQSADFRMFLHNREMADAIKSAFKKHANMALYDRIKTFYKYDV